MSDQLKSVFITEGLVKAAQFKFYEERRMFPPGVACAPKMIEAAMQVIFLAFGTIVWNVRKTGVMEADVGRFHLEVEHTAKGYRSLAVEGSNDWVVIHSAGNRSECVLEAAKWLKENLNEVDYRVSGVGDVVKVNQFEGGLASAACPACEGTGWRFPGRECTHPERK